MSAPIPPEFTTPIGFGPATVVTADLLGDLNALIGKHKLNEITKTPEWILARFMVDAVMAFNSATAAAQRWQVRKDAGLLTDPKAPPAPTGEFKPMEWPANGPASPATQAKPANADKPEGPPGGPGPS